MVQINVIKERIVNMTGHFQVKETYQDILDYMEETFQYDPSVLDYDEKNQGGKREINSTVEATRNVDSDYKIVLKFKIEFSGKDVNYTNDGKTIKTQNGKGKITMNAYITKPDSEATGFAKFLEKFTNRFIAHEDDNSIMEMAGINVGAIFERFKSHFQ